MLMNFCDSSLEPQIKCDCITSDGFEASNLVSSDFRKLQSGFLAENFIRTPVNVSVTFICSVDIAYIVIWPKVSNQTSHLFEISKTFQSKSGRQNQYKIAFGSLEEKKSGIVFLKQSFHPEGLPDQNFSKYYFSSYNVRNITSINVRILKASHIPAIAKIEIWGVVSPWCPLLKEMEEKWTSNIEKKRDTCNLRREKTTKHEIITNETVNTDIEIPEQFLDQITYEIMQLPMVLPSGKIVDQRTVEIYNKEEEQWGRPPKDPFTGLLFTTNRKPVMATELKVSIDSFLLKHSNYEPLKKIPRTVGTGMTNSHNLPDYRISVIVGGPSDFDNNRDRLTVMKAKSEKKNSNEPIKNKVDTKPMVNERNVSLHSKIPKNEALEIALKNTLQNLPSFMNFPAKREPNTCCEISNNQFYKLPCQHLKCRKCLDKKDNCCILCQKSYNLSQVVKVFR